MTEAATPAAGTTDRPVQQNSKILSLLWIGFYTAILTVFTLGIFQFWGRTQARRRIWKETAFDNEPFEYTGKGSELFFGFLLASVLFLVVLGAIFGAPLLVRQFFGDIAGVIASIVGGLVYVGLFLVLPGAAIFLARRYVLSRTTWRGIRFEQDGKAIPFGLRFFVQNFLTIITLGIYAPIASLRVAEMFWSKTKFGDLPFSFDAAPSSRTEPVWASFWLSYIGGFLGLALFVGSLVAYGFHSGGMPDPTDSIAFLQFIGVLYGALFLAMLIALPLSVWHAAVMIRQTIKLISLGDMRFSSSLGTWSLVGLIITNFLLIIFTLGFGMMAAEMRVWRKIARSLTITGPLDYSAIHQAASRGPSTGEGLATALDLGGAL